MKAKKIVLILLLFLSSGGTWAQVTGITIDQPSDLVLTVGDRIAITSSISPNSITLANAGVTWSLSNTAVANFVTDAGSSLPQYQSRRVVNALSAGTTTITVTTDNGGFTATCNVTILPTKKIAAMTTSDATVNLCVRYTGDGLVYANGVVMYSSVYNTISADADGVVEIGTFGSVSSLTHFYCSHNNLNALDVSGLSELYELDCSNNNLSSLDVSGLSELYGLGL